jgi:NAD(P)-dependent dehydrogenase (short-subunit alcohol dehydrogenase family)
MAHPLQCAPDLLERDLAGKTYIVTGANSGIGLSTTQQLVRQGAHVVMACRRVAAGEAAAGPLADGRGSTEVMALDLESLASVRDFAAAFKKGHRRLDALVNNAGIMAVPFARTEDGFESQLGVNHLGHFLLTELLLDVLTTSAPSRVVVVSSVAHAGTPRNRPTIHFADLNYDTRPYSRQEAYAQSKLANVLHALELARRLEATGVTAVSLHPGWARSNLVSGMMPAWIQNVLMRPFSGPLGMLSNDDAAQTSLHCLLDDDVPNHAGEYYSQISTLYAEKECRGGGWPMASPNPNAHDAAMAGRLYDVSRELVGM